MGAAAVSLARIADDGLVYLAADGAGAGEIVGRRLPPGRGVAGFVAATGQALVIDRTADDPRFARDVAEATGYVPTTLLVVPVLDAVGEPAGVLSVLDRGSVGPPVPANDALAVAAAFAEQAALALAAWDLDAADEGAAGGAGHPVELVGSGQPLDPASRQELERLLRAALDVVRTAEGDRAGTAEP